MIEPVFEELAREKKGHGNATGSVAFAKVDLSVGLGSMVAREYNVTATPTFVFFWDGKKVCAVSSWSEIYLFFFYPFHTLLSTLAEKCHDSHRPMNSKASMRRSSVHR
jgi:thiol-disulfide isomerase/thioredoxin